MPVAETGRPALRAGIYQSALAGRAPEARLDRLAHRLDGADLDLMVCPELFLHGYFDETGLPGLAIGRDDPLLARAAALARESATALILGYAERAAERLFNTAAVFGPDGAILGHHRKRLASPHSFEERLFRDGDAPTLVEIGGFRVGVLICYEAELPELAREAALAGAEMLCVPTALVDAWPDVAARMMPTRAFENGAWLLYANHAGAENGARYLGGSRIIGPDGKERAIAGAEEALITAEIDAAAVDAARARLPYLRDARRARSLAGSSR